MYGMTAALPATNDLLRNSRRLYLPVLQPNSIARVLPSFLVESNPHAASVTRASGVAGRLSPCCSHRVASIRTARPLDLAGGQQRRHDRGHPFEWHKTTSQARQAERARSTHAPDRRDSGQVVGPSAAKRGDRRSNGRFPRRARRRRVVAAHRTPGVGTLDEGVRYAPWTCLACSRSPAFSYSGARP